MAPNYEPLFRLPRKNYPACPKCGKATFLHHDYQLYSNFRCNDRKNCNHSFSVVKLVEVPATSSKDLKLESFTMKRMRHPFHIVLAALVQYFIANSTFRKVAETLYLTHQVKVSHVTISKWCKRFAPAFLQVVANCYNNQINLADSDEWHLMKPTSRLRESGIISGLQLILKQEWFLTFIFHLTGMRPLPFLLFTVARFNMVPLNPCAFLIAILRTERPLKDYFLKKYISELKTLLMTFLTTS